MDLCGFAVGDRAIRKCDLNSGIFIACKGALQALVETITNEWKLMSAELKSSTSKTQKLNQQSCSLEPIVLSLDHTHRPLKPTHRFISAGLHSSRLQLKVWLLESVPK